MNHIWESSDRTVFINWRLQPFVLFGEDHLMEVQKISLHGYSLTGKEATTAYFHYLQYLEHESMNDP